jgi:hypothetical protein
MEPMDRETQDSNVENDRSETNSASTQTEEKQNAQPSLPADASVDIQTDLSHLSGTVANIAGRDINIRIKVDKAEQVHEVLQALKEEASTRRIPPPPPPDAPLQKQVDHWFANELETDRQKFFALALSIFNGLKYPDFKDIYELVLHVMGVDEAEEEKPPSRFATADDELISQAKAEISPSGDGLEEVLKFKDEQYVGATFSLMRRRYRNVLLDLLPALKQVVERYRYWEVRYRAALAVAEIGKMGFHRVRSQVLQPWAGDPRAYVRASAGYPLVRLAEDETSRSAVEGLLADWTDERWSGPGETWRYRWTAASTYKQIGSIEADWARNWAYQGLKKIAGFDDIRLADAVIHSLVVLSLQGQLEQVLLTIKEWIEEGSAGSKEEQAPQVRCIVGILAFMVLSEVHVELATEEKEEADEAGIQAGNLFELVRQSEAEKGDYWQLVVAVGVRAFEYRLADHFFNLIARWTRYAADDLSLQDTVRNLLADVFVQVRPRQREHILNRLNRWQRQTKEEHLAAMVVSAKARIKERVLSEPLPTSTEYDKIVFGD